MADIDLTLTVSAPYEDCNAAIDRDRGDIEAAHDAGAVYVFHECGDVGNDAAPRSPPFGLRRSSARRTLDELLTCCSCKVAHAQGAQRCEACGLLLGGSDELVSGTMVGEYRIEGKLGEGGMGTVYAAMHPVIGKRAAIKVISRELCTSPEAAERFVLEARAVNQIGDPNIVDIFAFGTLPDGRAYFVMEWLLGENLADRLAREGLSPGDAIVVLDTIARTLEIVHEAGITHRDLKPDNVFLVRRREGDEVKLLDFGIAKLGRSDGGSQRTRTGIVMGTPAYLSTEQARGVAIDHRADIYALGAMAYELLCGAPPYVADSSIELMAKHITHEPPDPRERWPEIPDALATLLPAMIAKDPAARPTLAEVRASLAEASAALPPDALPVTSRGDRITPPPRMITPPPRAITPARHLVARTPSTPIVGPAQAIVRPGSAPPQAAVPTTAVPVKPARGRRVALVALCSVGAIAGVIAVVMTIIGDKPERSANAPVTDTGTIALRAPAHATSSPQAPDTDTLPAIDEEDIELLDDADAGDDDPDRSPPAVGGDEIGTLLVEVEPALATVMVDGRPVKLHAGRARIRTTPGVHVVLASAPDRHPDRAQVRVKAGRTRRVQLRLAPAEKWKPQPVGVDTLGRLTN